MAHDPDEKSARIITLCVLVYVLAAVVTFGHAAARTKRTMRPDGPDAVDRFSVGMFSAIGWPLYWSWSAWEQTP